MDAAFFRFLGPELAGVLTGVRFDTVFSPAPGCWTFVFSPPAALDGDSPSDCRFLLAHAHSRSGILSLSAVKPVNPAQPPTMAMWLRKRLRGRRVVGGLTDWRRKRLALELTPGEGRFLLLCMDESPNIVDSLPDDFDAAPGWRSAVEALDDPTCPRSLRRALEREDPLDRDLFLETFLGGRSSGFFLGESESSQDGPLPWPAGRESQRFSNALHAAQAYAQTAFFAALTPPEEPPQRARARVKKRMALLDQDQRRLDGLIQQHLYGETVAANLSLLDKRAKLGPQLLEHPEKGPLTVPLDPSLTVLENMERFFRKAAKGRRGQVHVERLRREVEEGGVPPRRGQAQPAEPTKATPKQRAKAQSVALHRFRSSDGFVILRGKNSAANHRLLSEMASPFDFWLHAEGGPGAHVILKRDNPGQDVPERSLREAAVLAGLSSWRANDAKANVLVAAASEVRKMKGAALGQVRLDSAKTLLVDLDPELEGRLRLPS